MCTAPLFLAAVCGRTAAESERCNRQIAILATPVAASVVQLGHWLQTMACIACPAGLKIAFIPSRTTLLMLTNLPACGNWAGGIVKQHGRFGMHTGHMALPISPSGITGITELPWAQANMEGQLCKFWDGLHVSLRSIPIKRAKLCKCFTTSCALVI